MSVLLSEIKGGSRSSPAAIPTQTPRLKPEENSPTRAARLESRAPPHECGGSHRKNPPTRTMERGSAVGAKSVFPQYTSIGGSVGSRWRLVQLDFSATNCSSPIQRGRKYRQ